MTKWHLRSSKRSTGAKLWKNRKKKRMDRGSEFLETRIGDKNLKKVRSRGGNQKLRIMGIDKVNLADSKTGKITSTKAISITANPANPHFVRRNIITKGAIIKTEAGTGRVLSRPGQDGVVNAVLIEEKK